MATKRIKKGTLLSASILATLALSMFALSMFAFNTIALSATADAPSGNFTIYPTYKHGDNSGWIILDVMPGQTVKDSVTLENLSNQTREIRIEYSEAEEQGEKFIPLDTDEYKNIGLWTDIKKTTYTLAPREKLLVPVEFRIPRNADLNNYTGAVYAVEEFTNVQNIKVAVRIGVRTYINVTAAPLATQAQAAQAQAPIAQAQVPAVQQSAPHESAAQANVFASTHYVNSVYFALSLFGLIAIIFYNLIFILEKRKHAKKNA